MSAGGGSHFMAGARPKQRLAQDNLEYGGDRGGGAKDVGGRRGEGGMGGRRVGG